MGKLKPFVVATNTEYTVIVMATDAEDAVWKASDYYFSKEGEERDDWVAYDLTGDYLEPYDIWDVSGSGIDVMDYD
jgi:hypothetical protein